MTEVFIVIYCETGFGDHYASIYTGYNHFVNLKKIGIKAKVLISKGHKYFPKDISLSVIYNFSSFDTEVVEVVFYELGQHLKGLIKVYDSTQGQIWSSNQDDRLIDYCSKCVSINRYSIVNSINQEPFNGEPFFIDEIYEKSRELMINKNNIIGIHFRGDDYIINSSLESILNDQRWNIELDRISKIVVDNDDNYIYLSSVNRKICDHFKKKYKNVFTHTPTLTNLSTHNVCAYNEIVDDPLNYIQNSIDTLIEMVSFSYCKTIYSFGNFPSNFVLYGILNNKIHLDWDDKRINMAK